MKKINIIGASREDGLGNYLASSFADNVLPNFSDYEVNVFTRAEKWDADADIIILTLFDHVRTYLQEAMFSKLFDMVKDHDKQLVVVGSTVYHFGTDSKYAQAKRSLHDKFYERCKHTDQYKCKVLLVEPGSLELIRGQKPEHPFLLYSEVANVIKHSILMNPKFLHVALRGINT